MRLNTVCLPSSGHHHHHPLQECPHWREEEEEKMGVGVAKRGEGGDAEDRREDRCVNEEETEGKEQMRGSTVLTDVSCNMWWRTITA